MTILNVADPIALLIASHDALTAAGLRSAVYGGLALAAYGTPRETRDADLAITNFGGDEALAALLASGLDVSISFRNIRFGGNAVTRIAVIGGDELNTLDLVTPRSARFASAVIERSVSASLRGHSLHVVTPEDFVLLKLLSTRARDLEDASAVLATLGDRVDRVALADEVEALAAELTDHDVRGRFAALTAPR